jgi:hypothetical protein
MLKEFFKLDNKIIVITGASHIAFLDIKGISKVFFWMDLSNTRIELVEMI